MKADLHTHTNFSDGKYSVEELMDFAINNNLDMLSITDHDTFDGIKLASTLNKPLKLIYGIELSTYLNDESVHILGYFKDLKNIETMEPILHNQLSKRKDRAYQMLDLLKLHFNIDLNRDFVAQTESITRGTIAREIVKQGYPYTNQYIFQKMIGDGCPAYIPSSKLDTASGIKLIKDCGGLAVLAHPMDLKKNDPVDIIKLGVDGIEAIYAAHLDQEGLYREMAKKYNLFITGGTDFHYFNDGRHGNIGQTSINGADLERFLQVLNEH